MTREEAEKIAAKLVGTLDDSFDGRNGERFPAWEVTLAGNIIGYLRSAKSTEEVEERAEAWRKDIVQALLKE